MGGGRTYTRSQGSENGGGRGALKKEGLATQRGLLGGRDTPTPSSALSGCQTGRVDRLTNRGQESQGSSPFYCPGLPVIGSTEYEGRGRAGSYGTGERQDSMCVHLNLSVCVCVCVCVCVRARWGWGVGQGSQRGCGLRWVGGIKGFLLTLGACTPDPPCFLGPALALCLGLSVHSWGSEWKRKGQPITVHGGQDTSTLSTSQSRGEDPHPHPHSSSWGAGQPTKPHMASGRSGWSWTPGPYGTSGREARLWSIPAPTLNTSDGHSVCGEIMLSGEVTLNEGEQT